MRRLVLLAALLLAAPGAHAQGDSLSIRDFRAELVVRPDGALEVTETLRIAFHGPWNGILRDISLEHRTGEGRREKLRVAISPPTDEAGQPLRYELESPDGWKRRVRVWVPNAHDAERTLVIRYRVENALRFFYEGSEPGPLDELYWNVTGNDWTMPIERLETRIVLPAGVSPAQTAAYTGWAGAQERDADISADDNTVTVTSLRKLEAGEGLTVAVGWAPGVIPRPSAAERRAASAGRLWPLGLPVMAFFFAFRTWRRRGRDPEEREIVVGYDPPEGLTPAEVGTLVDHKVNMADVTATLVDLAVRGYMRIEEREEKKLLGLLSSTEYVFHLRRPRDEWQDLAVHERLFLNALFTGAGPAPAPWKVVKAALAEARGATDLVDADAAEVTADEGDLDSVSLSSLQNRFYTSLPGIHDAVYEKLIQRGYYLSRPDKVRAAWIACGLVMLMFGVVGGVMVADAGMRWVSGLGLILGVIGAAAVILGFGMVMPARTEPGARAREAALGFREFLDKVESDRYRRMITSPEMFERFLPYAMAFRVEDRWARAFDGLVREPPAWYDGHGARGFQPSAFTSRINTLSSQAGSTMSSSPSSSGSGGGGSSGGGSGGGGGSGF